MISEVKQSTCANIPRPFRISQDICKLNDMCGDRNIFSTAADSYPLPLNMKDRGRAISGQNQMEMWKPSDMCASRNIKYSSVRTCEMITYSAGLHAYTATEPNKSEISFFELWRPRGKCLGVVSFKKHLSGNKLFVTRVCISLISKWKIKPRLIWKEYLEIMLTCTCFFKRDVFG